MGTGILGIVAIMSIQNERIQLYLKNIQSQIKYDLVYNQMSLVEYTAPFTGEPVKRTRNKPLGVVVGVHSKPASPFGTAPENGSPKQAPSKVAMNVVQLADFQCIFRRRQAIALIETKYATGLSGDLDEYI